ncbi:jg4353 [Pararge aegeria aegeria]|uniref:Jg4353 protein n=1 Tax=Pararge aegeria aegeria TaxID=348720 RepID=A0A8S4RR24_9NEOP|nr:jg4353 [Pararge aegeria aegeria]
MLLNKPTIHSEIHVTRYRDRYSLARFAKFSLHGDLNTPAPAHRAPANHKPPFKFRSGATSSMTRDNKIGIVGYPATVKENIVKKPACMRDLYNVLKGVWSPPICIGPTWWTKPTYGLNPFSLWEETRGL